MNDTDESRKPPVPEKSEHLCVHCLGRYMGDMGGGLSHRERGSIIKNRGVVHPAVFSEQSEIPEMEPIRDCRVCGGLFRNLDHLYEQITSHLEEYEVRTFQIGVQLDDDVEERDRNLRTDPDGDLEESDSLKDEIKRLLGRRIETEQGLNVGWERPDVLYLIKGRSVEPQIHSMPVYGRYNKYSRQLPQTIFHCRSCRGRGCDECKGTGREYMSSVQERIQKPLLEQSEAEDATFHGAGREDINVRCLGQREFVVELEKPRRRSLDYNQIMKMINSDEEVDVFDLRETEKAKIAEIKQKRADKTYRAIVQAERDLQEEDLRQLALLEGMIEQDTPQRVNHRRADKTRKRMIHDVSVQKAGAHECILTITAEAGTYIKELIHGDEGRTRPSISSLLHTETRCEQLDVLDIREPEE